MDARHHLIAEQQLSRRRWLRLTFGFGAMREFSVGWLHRINSVVSGARPLRGHLLSPVAAAWGCRSGATGALAPFAAQMGGLCSFLIAGAVNSRLAKRSGRRPMALR